MLCLVVRDVYRRNDSYDLRRALASLFDGQGTWDSTGVYAFWDPATREILYIGMDRRLSRRFRAHNASPRAKKSGDKRRQVAEWFESNEFLGYSVVAQSSAVRLLAQSPWGESAEEVMGFGEGQLIETYLLMHGAKPPWNDIGGAVHGRGSARTAPSYLDLLTGPQDSLLVARRSIRELAADAEAQRHEATIHTARLYASFDAGLGGDPGISNSDIARWLTKLAEGLDRYQVDPADHVALVSSGYLLLDAPWSVRP